MLCQGSFSCLCPKCTQKKEAITKEGFSCPESLSTKHLALPVLVAVPDPGSAPPATLGQLCPQPHHRTREGTQPWRAGPESKQCLAAVLGPTWA